MSETLTERRAKPKCPRGGLIRIGDEVVDRGALMKKWTKYEKEQTRKKKEIVSACIKVAARLAKAGLYQHQHWQDYHGLTVKVERTQLALVRKALGQPLRESSRYAHKVPKDGQPGTALVSFTVEGYPGLCIQCEYPVKEGGKCRIVETVQSYKSISLVCDR